MWLTYRGYGLWASLRIGFIRMVRVLNYIGTSSRIGLGVLSRDGSRFRVNIMILVLGLTSVLVVLSVPVNGLLKSLYGRTCMARGAL